MCRHILSISSQKKYNANINHYHCFSSKIRVDFSTPFRLELGCNMVLDSELQSFYRLFAAISRLQIGPQTVFGNNPPQMVPTDLNIGFRGLAA